MIYIGLGGNIASRRYGPPVKILAAALRHLSDNGITVVQRSRCWRSAPVMPAARGTSWFVNGVAELATECGPVDLLRLLHDIEREFGRQRTASGADRPLDLDLLDYRGLVRSGDPDGPILPHPRLHERAFVLLPLAEIAPTWRHPISGRAIADLIAKLAPGQLLGPLESAFDESGPPS